MISKRHLEVTWAQKSSIGLHVGNSVYTPQVTRKYLYQNEITLLDQIGRGIRLLEILHKMSSYERNDKDL